MLRKHSKAHLFIPNYYLLLYGSPSFMDFFKLGLEVQRSVPRNTRRVMIKRFIYTSCSALWAMHA